MASPKVEGLDFGGTLPDGEGEGLVEIGGVQTNQFLADGQSAGLALPLGVQNVFAKLIHAGIAAGSKGCAGTICLSVPSGELIACAGEEGGGCQLNQRIILEAGNLAHCGIRTLIVGVVGEGHGAVLVAPDRVQLHVARDLQLAVGIVRNTAARGGAPAQEYLTAGSVKAVCLDGSIRAHGVFQRVNHRIVTAVVGLVGHRVCRHAADLGIQIIVAGDLGVEVEGSAILLHPAQELVALGHLVGRYFRHINGVVVRNILKLIVHRRFVSFIQRYDVDRSHPLGIQRDILIGHGLAGEIIFFTLAKLIVIPASESIALFASGRIKSKVVGTIDGLLVFHGNSLYRLAAADEYDITAVAGVIELGTVIILVVLGAQAFITGKAGDGIAVFVGDCQPNIGFRSVCILELIITPIIPVVYAAGFVAGQDFRVIFSRLRIIAVLLAVEIGAAQRHDVNACLCCTAIRADIPATAWPLITDICTVLGSDLMRRFQAVIRMPVFFFAALKLTGQKIIASPSMLMLFFSAGIAGIITAIEVDDVFIALVIYVDNGGVVTGNGLLHNGLRSETIIIFDTLCVLCSGVCLCTDLAGHSLSILEGIPIIVGVFLPVDHGILDAILRRPMCLQFNVFVQFVAKGVLSVAVIPTGKSIAGLGGGGGRFRIRAGCEELRLHIAAAVRIKGDPVAVFDLGVQRNVACFNGHRIAGERIKFFIRVPAGDGLIGVYREADVRKSDFIIGLAGFRGDDRVAVHKEHIVTVLNPGVKIDDLI